VRDQVDLGSSANIFCLARSLSICGILTPAPTVLREISPEHPPAKRH